MDFTFWLAVAVMVMIGLMLLNSLVRDVWEMLGDLIGAIASGVAKLRGVTNGESASGDGRPQSGAVSSRAGSAGDDAYMDYLGTWRGRVPLLAGLGMAGLATLLANSVYASSGWVVGLIVWGVGLAIAKGAYEMLDDWMAPPMSSQVPSSASEMPPSGVAPVPAAGQPEAVAEPQTPTPSPATDGTLYAVFNAEARINDEGDTRQRGVSGFVTDDHLQLGFDHGPPRVIALRRIVRVAMSAQRTLVRVKDHALEVTLDDGTMVDLSRFESGSVPDELFQGLVLATVEHIIATGDRATEEIAYLREIRDGQHVQADDDGTHFTLAVSFRPGAR